MLAFLSGLLIIHTTHPWAPSSWLRGRPKRDPAWGAGPFCHFPNLALGYVKRRYFRYTPRRPGFSDSDNTFFEFAMDRRWPFFRSRAWGEVQVVRVGSLVVVAVASIPLHTHGPFYSRRRRQAPIFALVAQPTRCAGWL